MSEIGRITGVFVNPRAAFTDILRRPRWFVPAILLTILVLLFIYLYSQHVGWERVIRQSMDSNARTQSMTAEQRDAAVATGMKFASVIGYVQSAIGPTLAILIVAGVLLFIANSMLGTKLSYGQMSGITAYAFLTGLVSTTLMIVVMLLKNPEDFDIRNPLAFNAGAFLNPESTAKWIVALASSFDLFSFWTMSLLAIGISTAGRKISFGKAFGAVLIPWIVWVIIKTGWTALFS